MTPQQKRSHRSGIYNYALYQCASANRKSRLGRFTALNSAQSGWIKSLLTVWGECMGGKTSTQYRLENNDRFWEKLQEDGWSDTQLMRINAAIDEARAEGYRGNEAIRRARAVLWPVTVADMLRKAERQDDTQFIEEAILGTFANDDPVFMVGVSYYTTRKKISDIARELESIAPWLTGNESRRRVRWCLQIFEAKIFIAARRKAAMDKKC